MIRQEKKLVRRSFAGNEGIYGRQVAAGLLDIYRRTELRYSSGEHARHFIFSLGWQGEVKSIVDHASLLGLMIFVSEGWRLRKEKTPSDSRREKNVVKRYCR